MGKKIKKYILITLLAAMTVCTVGCGQSVDTEDLNQSSVRIGVEYGTIMQDNKEQCYPNAETVFEASLSDGVQQLESGQIDALIEDRDSITSVIKENRSLEIVEGVEFPVTGSIVVGISKTTDIPDAQNLVNEFLQQIQEDGTLEDIEERWTADSNYTMPDIPKAENPSGTMVIGTTALAMPFTFYSDNELAGIDIELAERFAYWAGMDYEFEVYDWNGLYTAIGTGAVDFVFSDLYYQEDSESTMYASNPYRVSEDCLVIKKQTGGISFSEFKEQFYNNFIKENRWLMLVNGLKVTVVITVLAAVFGCLLGFVISLGKRSKNRALKNILNALTHVIKSVPLLVLLLILYYVVFKNVNGIVVTVIAFSVNFGAFISDTFVSSIGEVDKGQWEVAQTLGFSRKKTFWRIIMPQASRVFLPAYLSSVVSMMLLTSVVGYISLVDVTFAAQMIRARTYNAIYTLLATAIIYFLLATLLNVLLRVIVRKVFTERNPLKGLNTETTHSASAYGEFGAERNEDETVIEIKGLTKAYPEATPLQNLGCEVKRGEVVTIIGPSGTGKSTLMRLINRLEDPTEGSVKVFGTEVSKGKPDALRPVLSRTGMVFQNFCLFEHLTVIENVMIAQTEILHKSKQEAYETAVSLLSALGLKGKELHYPGQMSGGQRQRVAIARALAMNPEILFFDEPTSALDPNLVGEVICVMKKLAETGMTMMVVTHDMKLAQAISDRVFYMDQGVVYEQGTPDEIFLNPKTDRCRIFIRKLKTLNMEVSAHHINLPEMVEAIDDFCGKYDIRKACRIKLYQIAEELSIGMILDQGYEKTEIRAEYDPETEGCIVEVVYAGKACNVLSQVDERYSMNFRILLHEVTETNYSYQNETNTIVLRF